MAPVELNYIRHDESVIGKKCMTYNFFSKLHSQFCTSGQCCDISKLISCKFEIICAIQVTMEFQKIIHASSEQVL